VIWSNPTFWLDKVWKTERVRTRFLDANLLRHVGFENFIPCFMCVNLKEIESTNGNYAQIN
jgi:hypothetical protein